MTRLAQPRPGALAMVFPGERSPPLHQLHLRPMSCGGGEAAVSGEERGSESLGERHIDGVIGGEIVVQLPHPHHEPIVRIAAKAKRREVVEGRAASHGGDLAGRSISAQDLRRLQVDQMRRVKRFSGVEQPPLDGRRGGRAQEDFQQR
jgi:hypothetical protein